jgi:hypothetical protein
MKLKSILLAVTILTIALGVPSGASAQTTSTQKHDSLWDGVLIGAVVGTAVGMFVMPPAFCGRNDSECSAIVRVVIGLPSIGVGIGVGALADHLHHQRGMGPAPFESAKSLNMTFRF